MNENKIDYYSKAIECIEKHRKGYYGYNFDDIEYSKFYYCIKLIGKPIYNHLCDKSSNFIEFCKSVKSDDLSLDLYRAPLMETKLTTISSKDPHSYTERTTYQRSIETDESNNVKRLIWSVMLFSDFAKKVWEITKS